MCPSVKNEYSCSRLTSCNIKNIPMSTVNSIVRKKMPIIAIASILFILYSGNVDAQHIHFTCKLDSTLSNNQYTYSITVNLPNAVSSCSIRIFEQQQNLNYHLLEHKEHITSGSYTFYTSERRKWMVMVESGNQNNSKIIK